jgi:hypothetical protein
VGLYSGAAFYVTGCSMIVDGGLRPSMRSALRLLTWVEELTVIGVRPGSTCRSRAEAVVAALLFYT